MSRRDLLRLGGVGLAGAASLGIAGCGGGGGGAGGRSRFRLAEVQPDDYPTTLGDKKFADLVRERTDGRIDIRVFANGQLGEEAAVIEQVQIGAIEMTRVSSAPMTEFASGMGVFNLPFIFDSGEHMWKFLNGADGQRLLDGLEPSGFKGLAYYDAGARSFYTTKKEVQSVEDLRGLKFRVQQADVSVAFIKALGASPTPMDYGEVYSSLQSGLIDGAENNPPSYHSSSHYEVAKNYTLDEHTRVPEVLIMSQDRWNGLSDEDKEIIQGAAKESVAFQREKWDQRVTEDMEKLRAAGVNIIEIDDPAPWREATRSVIERYRKEYGEVLDQIAAAR
ncbi:MAG: DctP family TRAP transporter solute-binding subunit [Streptosporangiales bacterium]|nr:DctP family TRAP transporter solute-binding subunit [Streptosporangiales bacterium]